MKRIALTGVMVLAGALAAVTVLSFGSSAWAILPPITGCPAGQGHLNNVGGLCTTPAQAPASQCAAPKKWVLQQYVVQNGQLAPAPAGAKAITSLVVCR